MNAKKIKISRDEILRIIFLKKEIKTVLLKSILKNQQIKPVYRGLCSYKLQRTRTYLTRQKNICIITGKYGGVFSISNTSRQVLNKLLQEGFVTNMKTNNSK